MRTEITGTLCARAPARSPLRRRNDGMTSRVVLRDAKPDAPLRVHDLVLIVEREHHIGHERAARLAARTGRR